jgi:hypothetical protein
MKRRDFIKYLQNNGCMLISEGAKHSAFLIHNQKEIPRYRATTKLITFLQRKYAEI